ncbi:MAG: methyltransferase domain-containing protein [Rhodothermia bacterium]|nr:methyltransferase domain-containing protein [Rhodothermia bacterium]
MIPGPDFARRYEGKEMMDDPDAAPELLEQALRELPAINRWLGGYSSTLRVFDSIADETPAALRILDVGTGIGDYARQFVRWGMSRKIEVSVVAVDLSERIVEHATRKSEKWEPDIAKRVTFQVADARSLPFESGSFDVATAALFFHHLSEQDAVMVLREMSRVARMGVIVNDIHRTAIAYHGIRAFTGAFRFSPMVRHDGPLSVRRAFKKSELLKIASDAGLEDYSVRWEWAFRWILTDIRTP